MAGCEHGPLYGLEHGLADQLQESGIDAAWAVNPEAHWNGPYGRVAHAHLPPRGSAARHEIVAWHCRALAGNVEKELRQGRRVVTIGGDHTMAAGSISGAAAAFGPDTTIGVIWVDAHADINTTGSSVTKALHGMPVAALLGLDPALADLTVRPAVVRPENIIYAGLRDIDPGERDVAAPLGMTLPPLTEIRQQGGVSAWLQDAVTHLAARCDNLVLSIDLDAFSTDLAPAVGTPVPGGFMPDEILPVLAGIVRTHGIQLIDLVEFNPRQPGAEKTAALMTEILRAVLPGRKP